MRPILESATTIARSPDAVSRAVAGEALVFDLGSNRFFTLDGVGTRVWELIAQPTTFGEVLAAMLSEYDVEEERLAEDLQRLFGEMAEGRLVRLDGPPR